MKNKTFRAVVFASLTILLLSILACGSGKTTEKISQDALSPAEIANRIIEKEKENTKNPKGENKASASEISTIKTPQLEKLFTIEGSVDLKQANFLKEVPLLDLYGEKRNVWMQSSLSFQKTARKNQDISDRILLLVFLKPTRERDDNNYVTLEFIIHPPGSDEARWSADIQYFDSRTQGQAQFSFAYDIFTRNWKKEDINNLAQQILNIALKKAMD